jgi:hypothetical protein
MQPKFSLDGKVSLVTGPARGIGFAMATALARAGSSLVLVDRLTRELEEAAQTIAKETHLSGGMGAGPRTSPPGTRHSSNGRIRTPIERLVARDRDETLQHPLAWCLAAREHPERERRLLKEVRHPVAHQRAGSQGFGLQPVQAVAAVHDIVDKQTGPQRFPGHRAGVIRAHAQGSRVEDQRRLGHRSAAFSQITSLNRHRDSFAHAFDERRGALRSASQHEDPGGRDPAQCLQHGRG